jgi:stress-induced morphogen
MAIAQEKLEQIFRQNFPEAVIEIIDTAGDSDHYSVTITDKIFSGKSRIEQHKIVNQALGSILGNELHAMQLKTKAQ